MTEAQEQRILEWHIECQRLFRELTEVWNRDLTDTNIDERISDVRKATAQFDLAVFRGYRMMFAIRMENWTPTTREQPATQSKPTVSDIANLFE